MPSPIVPSEVLDRSILDYVLTITERARSWWTQEVHGTTLSRKDEFQEYRLRMEGRRSVAELYADAKTEPFDGASNVGVGIESIFSEFLIPLLLANRHDLDPMLQVTQKGSRVVQDDLTTFHDTYHRFEVPQKRELLEYSAREVLTVGSAFHKWPYGRLWRQSQVDFPVWVDPMTKQPMMSFDQGTGRMLPQPADPKTPEELIPRNALGMPMTLGNLKAVQSNLKREGPELAVRPVEAIGFPDGETRPDPDSWEWLSDDFQVSPYWFLGREGDAFQGKFNLKPLWRWLAIDPDHLYEDPIRLAQSIRPIRLRVFHGKYPAAADGSPVEIVCLIARDAKLNLGWLPSPFPRRPYFNQQVWHSGTCPIGKGIPETVFSLRSAMDALLNQDIDHGNLYNHPPLLLSDLAMLEDEDYETTGPGATWIMRDINGAKFLPTATGGRDPLNLLNWLISNAMRIWGVTDLTLNQPSNALSNTPNTARGTRDILTTGSVKFGHLTKRMTAVDTTEYQYVHEAFRLMLANPKLVTQEGQPFTLPSEKREQYFGEQYQVSAVGNGISTNPILRQQTFTQVLIAAQRMQNPFLIGDLEAYKQLTDAWVKAHGIDITTKDPEALQQSQVFLALMQTPEGQQVLPQILQQLAQAVQARSSTPQGGSNGRGSARPSVLA